MAAPEAECLADAGECFGGDEGVREDAVEEVAIEDGEAGLLEAGAGGEELGKDVLAGAALFQHLAEATDLTFDSAQAIEEFLVVFDWCGHGAFPGVDKHTPGGYLCVKQLAVSRQGESARGDS